MHCSRRLIVQTLVFSRYYLHRQVSPPETLVVKGGTTWARNGLWILPENARLPRNIQGSFTCHKSTTWDKRLYFPPEGRHAEDFFRPEKSTASALSARTWVPKASTLPLDLGRCVRWVKRGERGVNLPPSETEINNDKTLHEDRRRVGLLAYKYWVTALYDGLIFNPWQKKYKLSPSPFPGPFSWFENRHCLSLYFPPHQIRKPPWCSYCW